jgi:ABC-type uncharacterized transport system substrate-binding protein
MPPESGVSQRNHQGQCMLSGSCDPSAGPRKYRLSLLALAMGLCLWAPGILRAQPCDVALVLTPGEPYEQAATPIRDLLAKDLLRCDTVRFHPNKAEPPPPTAATPPGAAASRPADDAKSDAELAADRLAELKPKLIVAIGTAATSLARQALPGTPVVFCMVPNFSDRPFAAGDADHLAGVTTDIAPMEQFRWINRLCPSVRTIGILHGERTRKTVDLLSKAAQAQDLAILRVPTKLDQFPAALAKLEHQDCDAVLMIADAEVYNAASVQLLLVWGVRNRKPVWAFSPHLVKSGAFAAIYSEPDSTARQVTQMIKKILEGKKPKDVGLQYPDHVLKAANERTADLIGTPLARDVLDALDAHFGQK